LIGDAEQLRKDGSVLYSSGISPAYAQYDSLPYWPRAFVPKLPWRPLTDEEFELLLGSAESVEPGHWVEVVKVPQEIFDLYEGARTASRQSNDQALRAYTTGAECQKAIQATVEYARTLTWPEHPKVDRPGVFFKASGLPTTTPRNFPELLGLHIDTAYRNVRLEERRYAPCRLAINVGIDDRFFLFVSISVDQIQCLLNENGIYYCDEPGYPTHEFRTAFMSNFPDSHVVKLRIRPGEAYLAPTENLIHDGNTVGQKHFDVQFSCCGHFRPHSEFLDPLAMVSLSEKLLKDEVAAPLKGR